MAIVTKRDTLLLAFLTASFGTRALPPTIRLRYIQSFANWLGALWYRFDRPHAMFVRKNLQSLLGHRLPAFRLDVMARTYFQNFTLGLLMNDMLPTLTLSDMQQFLSLEGAEHLEHALSLGRGVVLLGAHFGLHGYTALMFIQRLGYPIAVVTQEGLEHGTKSWFDRRVVTPIRYRFHDHMRTIARTGVPQRAMADCLRQNHILLIMGDVLDQEALRPSPPNVLPAPLLDHSIPLNTGPFRLARWLNTPVVPFFMVPRPAGFTLVIQPPLELSQGNSTKGLLADLAAFTARLELYILRDPELWFACNRRDLQDLFVPSATKEDGYCRTNSSACAASPQQQQS
jgi:lauroyl/myristoyl acyltransferase